MQTKPTDTETKRESLIEGVFFFGALAAISIGFALAWLPLGLIVPGSVVLILLIWKQLR